MELPEIESSMVMSSFVIGVVDARDPHAWRQGLLLAARTPDSSVTGHQLIVEGREADPDAPDELVVGEQVARAANLHPGDELRIGSWSQPHIDDATDGLLAPETDPVVSTVVGVVRFAADMQPSDEGGGAAHSLPAGIYAGPAWANPHSTGFATYGSWVGFRVRGGSARGDDLVAAFAERPHGWTADLELGDSAVDVSAIRRAIRAEREGVLIFAAVSGLAAVGIAFLMTVAVSPLEPVGLARKMEYSHPVRFDAVVLAFMKAAIIGLSGLVALVSFRRVGRRSRTAWPRRGPVESLVVRLGPVNRASSSFARGGSPRAAIVTGAVALAGIVAAGTLATSFNRVIHHPPRFGAWWDVAVGQYAEHDKLAEGVAKLRHNPAVVVAVGYLSEAATVDGSDTNLLAGIGYIGNWAPVMASGQAPAHPDEIALGTQQAYR
jgi:hypothetical protein